MMKMIEQRLLRLAEACEVYAVDRPTLRAWIRKGAVQVARVEGLRHRRVLGPQDEDSSKSPRK